MAALAAAEGRPERAVRLHACAGVLREAVGSHLVEPGWPDIEHNVNYVRSVLGAKAFTEAWEQGRALTLDEALDYALAEADPEPSKDVIP